MRAVRTDGVTLLKLQVEDAQFHARLGRLAEARNLIAAAGDVGALPFSELVVPDHHLAEVEVATWDHRPDEVLGHALIGLAGPRPPPQGSVRFGSTSGLGAGGPQGDPGCRTVQNDRSGGAAFVLAG